MTRPFPRVEGHLRCGEVTAAEIAHRFGTPLFVYDIGYIAERVTAFRDAFSPIDHLIAYSVKANGNLSILRRLGELGCGADITSAGELFRSRKAGIPAERIVFAGVGKSSAEIVSALEAGIYAFNVESRGELERLDALAAELGVVAPFGLRVNPDVLAETPHAYTRTGHAQSKFGVPWHQTRSLYEWARGREHLRALGIDVHIGSQIVDTAPYARALERVMELVADLAGIGIELEFLDLGGGYGISYDGLPGMDLGELAEVVCRGMSRSGLRLVLEPGRALVGDAGILLTSVEYVKRSATKTFVVVDGGMTELIRPSHYGGYHTIERVGPPAGKLAEPVDVVGPICETGDFLALDRMLEVPEPGELLAVRTVGAYGFAMASNYNGRLRPAEAMVDGSKVTEIRRRETLEDLIRGEE